MTVLPETEEWYMIVWKAKQGGMPKECRKMRGGSAGQKGEKDAQADQRNAVEGYGGEGNPCARRLHNPAWRILLLVWGGSPGKLVCELLPLGESGGLGISPSCADGGLKDGELPGQDDDSVKKRRWRQGESGAPEGFI